MTKSVFRQSVNHDSIIAKYLIQTKLPLKNFGKTIVFEQTVGLSNYSDILKHKKNYNFDRIDSCVGKVCDHINITENKNDENTHPNKYIIEIEFPFIDFDETGGLPQILSIVAGQIFANVDAEKFRLIDIKIPKEILNRFKGPKFGLNGIRKLLNRCDENPLLGVIIRPNLGLSPDSIIELCKELAENGVDFIKDDEKFINPEYCTYEERVPKIVETLRDVYKKTGHKTIYIVNATTRADKLVNNALKLIELGAESILVNAFHVGLSAVQALAENPEINVPIYGHRAGLATFARSKDYGVDTLVMSKLLRLSGVDMFSVGMIGGVQEVHEEEVGKHYSAAVDLLEWHHIKPSLPISTAGMNPGMVPINIEVYGSNIALFAGKGVYGHPGGLKAGIKGMKQAIKCTLEGQKLDDVDGKNYKEMKDAIRHFGLL